MKNAIPIQLLSLVLAISLQSVSSVSAIDITVDYRYDDFGFFNPGTADGMLARTALEAAALRYSNVITSSLLEVDAIDDGVDARIGFTHPATGEGYQVSAANSISTDAIFAAGAADANEYNGELKLDEDEWLLFAGARQMQAFAVGGTGGGANFQSVFRNGESHLNRGFRSSGGVNNLPVWGGNIAFGLSQPWHFDLNAPAPSGMMDFYSVALHEIGHALGLSTNWDEWLLNVDGLSFFVGPAVLEQYNADNGTNVLELELASDRDPHLKNDEYRSFIFPGGSPNLVGTVGLNELQDLIMDPLLDFDATHRRYELTNVDVATLRDIGWETVDPDAGASCDLDTDSDCDVADLDQIISQIAAGTSSIIDRDQWLASAAEQNGFAEPFQVGDANLDGKVDAIDLNVVGQFWTQDTGLWSQGDFTGNGITDAEDLNPLGINWLSEISQQASTLSSASPVPEPNSLTILAIGLLCALPRRRQRIA